ncbi:tetratricopeptide repeat protein [Nonomuraea sp. NPDC049158]|uniref:tetratricopeptide repeat protein n=1 Tax=Nonomuraea sp. NPDC049158 TaxID=3155649 RepID=UPI0033E1E0CF
MAWLDDQRANLIAAIALSAEHRWDAHTWQLPHVLWRFFFVRGHVRDWIDTHLLALDAARSAGDPGAPAETMKNLGFAYWRAGHLSEALKHHSRALVLDQESGDRWGEAKTHNHLGFIYDRSGRFAEALDQQHRSLALYEEVDDRCGQGRALIGIGNAYRQIDQHAASVVPLKRALAITRDIDSMADDGLIEDACHAGTHHGREAVFSALGLHTRLQRALAREGGVPEPSPCSP